MSVSTEDFIKGIYQLRFDLEQKASPSNLAGRLGISQAAVTDMARKLSLKGLIHYKKYQEIKLTGEGEKMALQVIRRHRLWELFLARVLNMPVNEIHREAEMLEHQTSERLTEKLDAYLGRPVFDPHGDPIPRADGQMPPHDFIRLTQASAGQSYEIARIRQGSPQLSEFFAANQILVGHALHVEQIFGPETGMSVIINNKAFVINETISNNIFLIKK